MKEEKNIVRLTWEEYFKIIGSLPPKLTQKETDKQFAEYCNKHWPEKTVRVGELKDRKIFVVPPKPTMIKMKLDFSTWITIYEDLWEKYLEMSDEDQKIMEAVVTEIFARGFDKVEMDKISEEFEK